MLKSDAFEAATEWFDAHFNGEAHTESLVLGVLQAYVGSLSASQGATRYVDGNGHRWRMVPEFPDKEMQHAGLKALDQGGLADCDCDQVEVWKAMMAVAPTHTEPAVTDDLVASLRRQDDDHPMFGEAADRIEHLMGRVRELERDIEISDAEGVHAYALAVDDPGKNPPVLWKDVATGLMESRVFETVEDARTAQALLLKADRFYFGKNTYGYDVWVASRGDGVWAVWNGSSCFSRDGLWMYEPLPSSREEGFVSQTRYSFAEAVRQAEKALVEPRPEF